MAFFAPVIGAIAGVAASAAPVISAVAGIGSIYSALKKPKAASGAATEAPPVVPLPDETGAASRLRLAQTRSARSRRRGVGSTLVGGQLGDARAPETSAPLVLGRV